MNEMLIVKCLWSAGSAIILMLGSAHLYFTFYTNKFSSNKPDMDEEMKKTHPMLTNETSMWKSWIGFNASHSSGAIFIGIVNLYLVIFQFQIFQTSYFLMLFNIITICFYVWLAKRFWFRPPLIGLSLALLCYCSSYIILLLA